MKSKFATDPLDASDGFFNPDGAGVYANFFPAAGEGAGNRFPGGSPLISPTQTPTLSAEAVEAQSAQDGPGGPGSVVAETSGSGFTINLLFDAAAMAAPQSFRNGIEQAASILAATITNKITVNIQIDYSGTGGGAAAGPDNGQYVSYSTVKADLINNAAPGDTTFNALPSGSSIQGQSSVAVWNAQLKLFGLLGANDTTTDDGSATFATDINSNLLVGVALHELTHALGRIPYGSQPDIFDFYRFTSAGARLFSDSIPASAAYFSVDGGNTKVADYGLYSDPSDFLNPGPTQLGAPYSSLTPNDPFNEIYTGSTLQTLTAIDKEQLDALGFDLASQTSQSIVVTAAASEAVQGGVAVSLLSGQPTITDSASTTLSSATIKIANAGGSAVTGDELYVNGIENGSVGNGVTASWNASTDTLTLTGSASLAVYDTLLSEVTYQDAGTDSSTGSHPVRTVTWSVNDGTASFNTTSQIEIDRVPVVSLPSGANVAVSASQVFQFSSLFSGSDPDGDTLTYYLYDSNAAANSGHFVVNGAIVPADTIYQVSAAQLAQTTFVAGAAGTSDNIYVEAFDGHTYSGWNTFVDVSVAGQNPPPQVSLPSGANVAASASEVFQFSSLFSGSDPDGDTLTYYLYDSNAAANSGHFVVNGAIIPADTIYQVSAAQLAQTTFVAGVAGASDNIYVEAGDGNTYSGWNTSVDVSVAAAQNTAPQNNLASSVNVSGNVVSTPAAQAPPVTVVNNDTFVFRSGLGAGVTANAGSIDTTGHDGFAWVAGNAPAAAPPDAEAGMPHPVFPWADADPSHHDGAPAMNFHLIDPHANGFIIG
jgi:hypothetical protein